MGHSMLTLDFLPAAVVFDMDGLIFDTETLYRDAMMAASAERGVAMPMDLYLRLIGLHGPRARELVLEELGPDTDVDGLWNDANARFAAMLDTQLAVKAGVLELLDTLDRLALPRAIATSSSHAAAEHHLAAHGLTDRFNAVIAAGDFRLVRSPIRIGGYEPDYRPPPTLGEHGPLLAQTDVSARKSE